MQQKKKKPLRKSRGKMKKSRGKRSKKSKALSASKGKGSAGAPVQSLLAAASDDDKKTTDASDTITDLRQPIGGQNFSDGSDPFSDDDPDQWSSGEGSMVSGSWDSEGDFDFDMDDDMGFAPVNLSSSTNVRQGRNALTASGIIKAREEKVQQVANTLSIPEYVATALLSHFGWDPDRFIHKYLDNPQKVLDEVGVTLDEQNTDKGNQREIECTVCWDDTTDFSTMPCSHEFCNECIRQHLESNLKEGKSFDILCMDQNCTTLFPEYLVRKVLDKELWQKYVSFASKQFVESQTEMRWCPAPGCTNAITEPIPERNCLAGYCLCGYRFCFDCNEEAHTPADCAMMKDWKKKCAEDAATLSWIASNTKDCPKCSVPIQKNDGCFQMTCRKCSHQWCWLCCGDWKTHPDHFKCNKFGETKIVNTPEWREKNAGSTSSERASLKKYVGYYNMFKEHDNASKFEDAIQKKAKTQMEALQEKAKLTDVTFIMKAYEQLSQMRSVLKYTYVFAYYTKDANKRELFEMYQQQLETVAENLTQELKLDVEKLDHMKVKNLTRVAESAIKHLLIPDA
mmetsp:Transcript_9734/g.14675  ORF Transcript_9734/g.14675 Transcript_9734/m.14675 type:complete len:568 (+) Transcript_9734:817-2520(+)